VGDFKFDKADGHGRLTRADGEVWEGPFVNGLPHGKGFVISRTGTVQEAE